MKRVIAILSVLLGGCSYANLDDMKAQACGKWASVGFECVGYDGFQWGITYFHPSYGGAKVWHYIKRKEAPGIIYTGYVQRWGDEIHVYGPHAIDALRTPR